MEKNSLEKLKNLMLKKYRKEISFRQLQKEFLKNDNERIEYRLFVKSGGGKSSIILRDSKLNKLFKVVEFFYPVR